MENHNENQTLLKLKMKKKIVQNCLLLWKPPAYRRHSKTASFFVRIKKQSQNSQYTLCREKTPGCFYPSISLKTYQHRATVQPHLTCASINLAWYRYMWHLIFCCSSLYGLPLRINEIKCVLHVLLPHRNLWCVCICVSRVEFRVFWFSFPLWCFVKGY